MLLLKADGMFPEGAGRPRAFVRDGDAAEKANGLLEIAVLAIFQCGERACHPPYLPPVRRCRLS